jgi:hypothetical protein
MVRVLNRKPQIAEINRSLICVHVLFMMNRTQDDDRGAHGALVPQGEAVSGHLCHEERRPKLVQVPLEHCYTF